MSNRFKVLPKDEKILFNAETLGAEVPPGAFAQATGPAGSLLRVTFQLRELHQLVVLEGVVVTGLFPDPGRVDHQGLLSQREPRSSDKKKHRRFLEKETRTKVET